MDRSSGGPRAPRPTRGRQGRPSGVAPAAAAGSSVRGGPSRRDRPAAAGRRSGPLPPAVAEDVDVGELPDEVRRDLRALPPALAERVGQHLVMAGRLLEEDPASAHEHSVVARGLAARVAAVREAAGVTAYRAGRYAEALGELRAVRRMTGSSDYLPVMADCERGLGRPQRALALAADADVSRLDRAGQVEMRIVAAGARRDLGQLEAALVLLRAGTEPDPTTVEDPMPRLWYAYADALLAAGKIDEAREWFLAAASVDDSGGTDADERLAELDAGGPGMTPESREPDGRPGPELA